jgi:hypothetical protein
VRITVVVAVDLAKGLATYADNTTVVYALADDSFDGRAGVVRDGCCRLSNTLWASKHNDNTDGDGNGIARTAME